MVLTSYISTNRVPGPPPWSVTVLLFPLFSTFCPLFSFLPTFSNVFRHYVKRRREICQDQSMPTFFNILPPFSIFAHFFQRFSTLCEAGTRNMPRSVIAHFFQHFSPFLHFCQLFSTFFDT